MKRIFAVLAALLPIAASAASITVFVEGQFVNLTDVESNAWFATYVRQAGEAGIVSGYKNANGKLTGKFGPGDRVTIAQSLKIAVLGGGYNPSLFAPAVGHDHWAVQFVGVALEEDFLPVFTQPSQFDRPATRAEVVQLIADAFDVDTETPVGNRYDDVGVSTEHGFAIEALSRDGVVSGDTDASGQPLARFRPTDTINRAETVKIIMNARAKYGQPGRGKKSPTDDNAADEVRTVVVTYTDDGFEPETTRIAVGTRVIFTNDSGEDMWVASDPHPIHTDLPAFDARTTIRPGDDYDFTFTSRGDWEYHNHHNPSHNGAIIVE